MTYCLGIVTKFGLVMASDSRSNAGYDQVNTVRKMHTFEVPGERAFVLLASGSLSLTQSILTLLRRDFDMGNTSRLTPQLSARYNSDARRDTRQYATAGSWGPEDAEALIARDGHHWASLPPEPKDTID